MNKKLICLLSFISLFCLAGLVYAQGITNPLGVNNFPALFTKIATMLFGLVTALGTIAVIISGIFFLTSAGNPAGAQRGKTALFFGCVGILVGLSANAITGIIQNVSSNGTGNVTSVLKNIATQVGGLVGGLSVVMVIIAGIFYLTSGGSPEKMKLAKTALTYAIVGIVICLMASSIVTIVAGLGK